MIRHGRSLPGTFTRRTRVLVETGFLRGDGVRKALAMGFEKVYSIELRKRCCEFGHKKFAQQIANGKVYIIHGKSEEMLAKIIKNIQEPITFFLDAHLGPNHLEKGEAYDMWCPLYHELKAIAQHPIKNHIILIDDVDRIVEDHKWTNEVEVSEIERLVREINSDYNITRIANDRVLYASMTNGKTVAFDLDDVICFRDETLPVEKKIGPEKYEGCYPNPDKIEIINNCYDAGYIIVLYTARGMGQFNGNVKRCEKELTPVTIKHLKEWGVKFHQIVFGKIHFDLLVDNKVRNSEDINSLADVKTALGDI